MLETNCVALLAEKARSSDVSMRISALWSLSNLAYKVSPAGRAALVAQLPAPTLMSAIRGGPEEVQVGCTLPPLRLPPEETVRSASTAHQRMDHGLW